MCIGITISEIRFWVGLKFFGKYFKFVKTNLGTASLSCFWQVIPKIIPSDYLIECVGNYRDPISIRNKLKPSVPQNFQKFLKF